MGLKGLQAQCLLSRPVTGVRTRLWTPKRRWYGVIPRAVLIKQAEAVFGPAFNAFKEKYR